MKEETNKLEFYIQLKNEIDKKIDTLDKKYSQISLLRIITFLAGIAFFIVGVSENKLAAGITGGVFLLAFFYLVKKHNDVVKESDVEKSKAEVVERYIQRFSDDWRNFKDNGKEYLSKEDTVASDIDLLGDNSLYQMINVCHTDAGKKRLSDDMKLNFSTDRLEKNLLNRAAIEELMKSALFNVEFEAAGVRLEKKKRKFDVDKFCQFCQDSTTGVLPKWANFCRCVLPIIEIILIVLWLLGVWNYGIPLVGFIAVLSFSWLTSSVTSNLIGPFYGLNNVFDDYVSIMKYVDENKFESQKLSELREILGSDNGALKALKKLGVISQAYNISFNPLIHQVLSGIVLWDYQLAYLICRWKKKYADSIVLSFDAIACMEELMSFAVLGIVRETNWADINTDINNKIKLNAEELFHPLIQPAKVVSNNVNLSGGITIITGSNMSGKTTYLRTLAINLALAYMGAPICGKSLSANYMKIFTSMRVTDDVAGGISTFYAEILRIKAMADYKANNEPMICLIDEIFKGTNSADRIVGAKEAITRLAGDKCMTIVSTHDFELCEIEDYQGQKAVNFHFEEYYNDNELKFDYKIKDGRCITTNARAILRMAGFDVAD